MSSKKTNLEMIARHLNENDDVHSAVDVWFSSYQKISAKEFLDCSDGCWSNQKILEIIEDEIMMLTSARDEIKQHLNLLEGK
jgi:hypothetical protein